MTDEANQPNPSLVPGSVHWFVKQIENRLEAQEREMQAIKRMVHELAVHVDSAFPGADVKLHYEEHEQFSEARMDRRRRGNELKHALTTGLILGIFVLIALLAWSTWKH